MKLYHGTSEENLASIMEQGIKPRGKGVGNWRHSVDSNPDFVYLTNAYPLYFAGNSIKDWDSGGTLAVFEIDTDLLDKYNLAPDEDWLEQSTRGMCKLGLAPVRKSMEYRTRWYRKRLKNTLGTDYWRHSLDGLGTCTHYGTVLSEAITRVALVSFDAFMRLMLSGGQDPTISLMNYRLVGSRYRNAVQWLFDGTEPPPDDWRFTFTDEEREVRDRAMKEIWSREGIRVLSADTMLPV